jgi:hypothetical protein
MWEKILVGIIAVLVILWVLPGARERLRRSREAGPGDWRSVVGPLLAVVVFVLILIMLVRA